MARILAGLAKSPNQEKLQSFAESRDRQHARAGIP